MGRFARNGQLSAYNKLRNEFNHEGRFKDKATKGEIEDFVVSRGGNTLNDIYGTLSPRDFNKYDSPMYYDKNKTKYKRMVNPGKDTQEYFYVMYPREFEEKSKLRKNDSVQVFTGTSSLNIVIKGVTENNNRKRSAYIKIARS